MVNYILLIYMEKERKWKNEPKSSIFWRLGLDTCSAVISSLLVSPIMYTVDKAVIEKTDINKPLI